MQAWIPVFCDNGLYGFVARHQDHAKLAVMSFAPVPRGARSGEAWSEKNSPELVSRQCSA
jgi:hypothetical protein